MSSIRLAFGSQWISARMDWGEPLGVLDVAEAPALPDVEHALREGLERPIGFATSFLAGFQTGETVAIVVSDAYRQTAVDRLLPALLRELVRVGISETDIRFIFASGTHRVPTRAQQRAILGSAVYARFRDRTFTCDAHNESRHVRIGTTARGTPVELNRAVTECDRVIATGAVVLHYFGGFGGGRKSIVPGLASARTIAHNHAINLHPTEDRLHPGVRVGVLDGNPVAEDMLEASQLARIHGIVNTVLNRDGQIAGVFLGEMERAHRAAAEFAQSLFAVPIAQQADLVIASAGPARNYVQSHKALYNAFQAMKPGGRIILAARCEEGLGGEQIEKWLRHGSADAIIAELRKQSEIYGQTALSTREKSPYAILVTTLQDDDIALIGARRANSLEDALDMARVEAGDRATYYIMPSASYTVPFFSANNPTA